MSEHTREQISALMDGELENGSASVLSALKDNPECRKIWKHYHLIGESLRGTLPKYVDMHLADRISAAIQNEPAILAPASSTNQFLKPAIGFAIAASVTVVAILGVRQAGIGPAATSTPVVAENQAAPAHYEVATITAGPAVQAEVANYQADEEAEARLNRYLVNYNEYRTNAGVQGMLPYVRIVAHEVVE